MSILDQRTHEEQAEFFMQCFSKFSTPVADDMANSAKLIFERPAEWWPAEKIVIEYDGKLHFYPVRDDGDKAKSIAAAVDTLVYEYVLGGNF